MESNARQTFWRKFALNSSDDEEYACVCVSLEANIFRRVHATISRGFIWTVAFHRPRTWLPVESRLEIKRNDEKPVTGKERKRLVKTEGERDGQGLEERREMYRDGGGNVCSLNDDWPRIVHK